MFALTAPTDVIRAAGGVPDYLGPTAALVIAAAVVGYLSVRVKVVPIVGFLLAGVLIGPSQLGLVATSEAVDSVAEIGVILLLFTIGIEFSLDRLARVWRWIVLGGGAQVLLATGLGFAVVAALGESWKVGLFTGFLIALSSTAIVLKLVASNNEGSTPRGQLSLSVLIFQDLAVVAMVLIVPLLGDDGDGGLLGLAEALGIALAVIAGVLIFARRVMPLVLERVAAACSPEVFLLAVIAICFGTAYATALAGVSVSLGAFLAGLVVSESRHSVHAFAEVLPLQILFSAVFFVSVGMLLDVGFLVDNLLVVLAVSAAILVGKTATTVLALLPLKVGWRQATGTGLMLGQVGEFSFVLLTVGTAAGLSPGGYGEDGVQTFVATTVLLMVATPGLAALGQRVIDGDRPGRSAEITASTGARDPGEGNPVVILGWGADSLSLAHDLRAHDIPVVMTTLNPDGAAEAEADGVTVVRGDSTRAHVLETAGIESARLVVIAEDEAEQTARVADAVRGATTAPILVRSAGGHLDELSRAEVTYVVDSDTVARDRLRSVVAAHLDLPEPTSRSEARVNVATLRTFAWPKDGECPHADHVRPVLPQAPGCVECLRHGDSWVHLRMCLSCGYVGCCDSSPGQHATQHHRSTEHAVMASAEPGENWAYCFVDGVTVEG